METARTKIIEDLVYPELSYQIVGVLYTVDNKLGSGYQEKYYQKAISIELRKEKITFTEQVQIPLKYSDEVIGSYRLDFLIGNKIALEIKKDNRFSKANIEQVYAYLKAFNLKLGILANFTSQGVKFKRIVNIK